MAMFRDMTKQEAEFVASHVASINPNVHAHIVSMIEGYEDREPDYEDGAYYIVGIWSSNSFAHITVGTVNEYIVRLDEVKAL